MESIAHRIQELATSLNIKEDSSFFIDYDIYSENEIALELGDSEYMEFPNCNGDFSFLETCIEISCVSIDVAQEINLSSLQKCHFLTSISINSAIVNVDEPFCMPNLKTLFFGNNSYVKTDSLNFLTQFPNLESLQYNFNLNTIHDIDTITQLPKLTALSFNNGIFSSVETFSKLTQLEHLYLHNCKNISDFNALRNLKKLTHLSLHLGNFNNTSILSNFKNLELLSIADIEVAHINEVRSLSKLKMLNLINTKLKTIDEIAVLSNLSHITVTKSDITEIPTLKSSDIVYANFSNNAIESIENLAENKSLQYLDITNNQVKSITKLPENLIQLYANNNPIEELHVNNCYRLSSIRCENHSIKEPENFSIHGEMLQHINLKNRDASFLFTEEYYKSGPPEKKFYHLFKIHGDHFFKKRLYDQAYKTYERHIVLKTISACRKIEQELLEVINPSFSALSHYIDVFWRIKKDSNRIYDLVGNKEVLAYTSDFIEFKIKNAKISEEERQKLNYKLLYKVYPSPNVKQESTKSYSKINTIEKSKNDRFIKNVERFFWILGIVCFLGMLFRLLQVFLFN